MKDRKKILICIDWYAPGFKAGGPIRSVVNIVNAFKHKFDFYILTSAYDLGETEPYEGKELNLWHDQDGVFVKYLEKKLMNSSTIASNIREVEPNTIYLNSLFSKIFTLIPLSVARKKNIRTIVAPRGMLGNGALEIKKTKKMSFIKIAKSLGWFRKVTWHASTAEEKNEILKHFGKKSKIAIAQNIPLSQELGIDNILDRKNTGKVKFVFISRITQKKNLHLAIDAIKRVHSNKKIEFDIYGNIEDQDYYDTFKKFIKKHGKVEISYKGVLNPNDIANVYANADFMLLPTKHENYGHTIVEAWANGCPVIISKYTPWKNLRVQNLGWDIDIESKQNLVNKLQEAIDIDFTSYIQMVRASYNYFHEKICDEKIIEANEKMFDDEN